MSLATITAANRAEWLAERRKGVGASEVAAVLGLDPYRSALDVFLDKIGQAPPREDTGRRIEATQVFLRHPGGILTATLDALAAVNRPVEFKTLNMNHRAYVEQLGEDGTDEVPETWQCQVQAQLLVAGADEADLAVFVGGDLRHYTIRRQMAVHAAILGRVHAFWAEHVLAKVPPPATRASDARALHALYPEPEGEVELPAEAADLVDDLDFHAEARLEHEKARDEAKARLLAALGPAKVGRLPRTTASRPCSRSSSGTSRTRYPAT
jgi:predicted phage-related endonuclease